MRTQKIETTIPGARELADQFKRAQGPGPISYRQAAAIGTIKGIVRSDSFSDAEAREFIRRIADALDLLDEED